jgi:hypothetical protein
MAEGKKSFVLYTDLIATVSKLNDNKAGKLFKLILDYVNDKNPEAGEILLQVAFEPIKQQLKRDLKDWEHERENRSKAGKKGMESRWGKRRKITKDNTVINPITKITDSATVTVNVNANVIYDAEQEILKNEIWLEQKCMANHKTLQEGKEILHTYHLYLEEKEQYPRGKKSVFSGFEKWLINEKKFNNGHSANQKGGKHTGALQLVKSLKEDYGRRKESS